MAYYNPQGYVRGGASRPVAKATVAKAKQKPASTPAGQAPAGAPKKKTVVKVPYKGYRTPAQVMADARAEAAKIIAAAVAPLNAQSKRVGEQYTAAGEGLAKSLEPLSGQIKDLYAANAADQAGLASGYSQAVQGVLNTDEAAGAGTMAALGLPALGAQPNAAVGNVIYGTGGSLPAQKMGTVGTAMAAAAASLPAGARLTAAADTRAAQQKFRDSIAELQAKRPEIYNSLLTGQRGYQDTLYDNWLQARAQSLYEQKFGVEKLGTAGLDAFGNPIPVKPSTTKGPKERQAENRADAIKFRNDETADAIADMTAWVENQLGPQKSNMPGEPVKAGVASKKYRGKIIKVQLYRTKDGGTTEDPTDPNVAISSVTTEQPGKVEYKVARDYIRGSLHARLDRFNWSKKQINEMTARILAQLHINPPKGKPTKRPDIPRVVPGTGIPEY